MRAAVFAQEIGSWEIIILGGHMSLDGNILFFYCIIKQLMMIISAKKLLLRYLFKNGKTSLKKVLFIAGTPAKQPTHSRCSILFPKS